MITHKQNRGDLCHHRHDTTRDIMLAWAALSSTMDGSCGAARLTTWPRQLAGARGFIEPDETIEQAVLREVAEEAGVTAEVEGILGLPTAATRTLAIACTLCSCCAPSVVSPSQTARK